MRKTAKQVELPFDPSQYLLVRDEELDVSRSPFIRVSKGSKRVLRGHGLTEVSNARTAQVADQTDVRDKDAYYDDEDEGRRPRWDFVRPDGEVRIRLVRLHSLSRQE